MPVVMVVGKIFAQCLIYANDDKDLPDVALISLKKIAIIVAA